jgi:DNA-binding transcriptional regulator YiaG
MANFLAALKETIRRLARREIKDQVGKTQRAVARHRREIAELKRQLRDQEKKLAVWQAQQRKRLSEPRPAEEPLDGVRFSPRSVKAQRNRLKLSAADYGKLVGVSALTVYNWEHGKSRPRRPQLGALVAVRGIGKREALARLEVLKPKKGRRKK